MIFFFLLYYTSNFLYSRPSQMVITSPGQFVLKSKKNWITKYFLWQLLVKSLGYVYSERLGDMHTDRTSNKHPLRLSDYKSDWKEFKFTYLSRGWPQLNNFWLRIPPFRNHLQLLFIKLFSNDLPAGLWVRNSLTSKLPVFSIY